MTLNDRSSHLRVRSSLLTELTEDWEMLCWVWVAVCDIERKYDINHGKAFDKIVAEIDSIEVKVGEVD